MAMRYLIQFRAPDVKFVHLVFILFLSSSHLKLPPACNFLYAAYVREILPLSM